MSLFTSSIYRALTPLACAAACITSAVAQPQTARTPGASPSRLQFGLHLAGLINTPSAEFNGLPGIPTCLSSPFSSGSGGGFSVSAMTALVPSFADGFASHIGATLRLGFASASTSFETSESIGPAIDRSGEVSDVIDTYTIETTFSELRLEPAITYHIGADVPLLFSIGAKLGFAAGSTYSQSEKVTSPNGATFADGSSERNASEGDIEEASGMLLGLGLGVGYDIRVSPTLAVRPEAGYMLGLTTPIKDVTWSPNEVRLGVSLLYMSLPAASTPLGD